VFHVTAASSGGELNTVSHIEMGSSQTGQNGAVDVDFLAYKFSAVFPAGPGGPPPSITSVTPLSQPPNGNTFWPAASGIAFSAAASGGKNIASSSVLLVLNGADVSSGLSISGGGTPSISATYSTLTPNTIYTGTIQVTDSGGAKGTYPLLFDTFSTNTAVVIEAEDYNHDSGQFTDNPAPNSYTAVTGMEGIDSHDITPATLGAYRTADAVDTAASADNLRPYFSDAGATEFDVSGNEQGEWMNYTRTFAAGGKYKVYLRYGATVAQSVKLDLVTGATTAGQTTSALGSFSTAVTGNGYTYAQLTDALGNVLVVNLSGAQTLRLTAPAASLNLVLNYLVLVPVAGGTSGPTIGFANPAPSSTTFLPDGQIQIAIVNRDTAVLPASINYRLDGTDVTGSSTITATASGALVTYQPPSQLALNSLHTNRVVFTNDAGTPVSFTNQWSFRVANLPVLLSSWATAPGSGTGAGLNDKIHWHNAGQDLIFRNNSTRAEDQVGGLLIDVDTGLPYVNDAAGPNSDGTFAETGVINYSGDATDQGFFTGDVQFPYVDPGTPKHIAMAVAAHLDLTAGLHRFGVRRNDGFKLSSGPHFSRPGAYLTLGNFESGGTGDDGTAATEFDFMVQSDGVYPFRLIWFQDSGPCNLEWYSVNRSTGARTLINSTDVGSVKAYMSRPLLALTPQKILNPQIVGSNITFQYQTILGYNYYVDYKDSLTDSWTMGVTPFVGDGGIDTFSAPATGSAKRFVRIRAQ